MKYIVGGVLIGMVLVGAGLYLVVNWNYRWAQQCAIAHGVMMENVSSARVCVRGPVEIITIAARPW